MAKVEKQTYLGDVISHTGYNDENISERCKTGHATISQIKSLLTDGQFGKFLFQSGLVLFVSKMLLNCEVWHSLTKAQMENI